MTEFGQTDQMETNQTNGDTNEDERKLFVGGLSWETKEHELKDYMEKYGTVIKCTLKKDPETNRSRGFGFVVFEDCCGIENVLAESNHVLQGKNIDPKRANPIGKSADPPVKKIYVGKVSPSTSEDQIKEYFNQYGNVTKIEAPFDKQNDQRKNYVFVEFESTEPVNKILTLVEENPDYKHKIGTDEVEIKKATPTQRTRGRGGYGRGGDRGRGGHRGGYGGYGGGWDQGYNQGYGGGYGGYSGYGGYGYGGGYDGYSGYGGYGGGYDYNSWGGYGGGYGGYNYGGYGGGQYDGWGGWGGNYGDTSGQQMSNYGKAPKNSRSGGGGGGGGGGSGGGGQGYRPY